MPTARLLLDPPATGDWNMAVDEALLASAGATGTASLRFYTWSEPTLSLGYFQDHTERESHRPSQAAPIVRRATGGGAILHDRELTYSFVAPIADRLSADVERLYYAFHETLIAVLAEQGIAAELCTQPVTHPRGAEPFLCFQRRSTGDVLLGEHKIGGSAQRRHYGAVLQHGSILLSESPRAPELPGIAEIAAHSLTTTDLLALWQPRLMARLDLEMVPGELSSTEQEQAREFLLGKFARPEWTLRR
ncbi:MAG TPA: lipoate--protein ligase family protein [Pirellulaceae bacterium]|nr:lipoate--protein ligase family protein [Pirellulaceae bacterium]